VDLEDAFDTLTEWLEAEDHDIQYPDQLGASVRWGFLTDVNGIKLQVRSLAEEPFILLESRVRVDPEHEKVLADMDEDAQQHFYDSLQQMAFLGPEEWEIQLLPEEGESYVQMYRVLYPEDLDRQGFMDAVRVLRSRTQHVLWMVQRGLDADPHPAAGGPPGTEATGAGAGAGESGWSRSDFEVM
jgi:hypothetical protein